MPMSKEEHETLLSELLQPDLEQSRRTEILQMMRTDYDGVLNDFTSLTETNNKLQANNDDLIISNSKLFRQLGTVGDSEHKKQQEQKSFSETITLEALEK